MKTSKLLITGAGGPAAIAFMKAIRHAPIEVYAADMDPKASGLYLVPPARRLIVPPGRDSNFVAQLLKACRTWGIDVLVPTVDEELLPIAQARREFESIQTSLMLTSEASLRRCLDKGATASLCAPVIPTPRSAVLTQNLDLSRWAYPFIAKPRFGSGGRGVQRIENAEAARALSRDGELLVQEYLPGEEYSVDVLCAPDGMLLAAVPRSRLKVDSGVAVASQTIADPEMIGLAKEVVHRLGLSFVSNVQFRRCVSGVPRLLEVNPRFPGTMSLTVASGINMPELALRLILGQPIPERVDQFEELMMVRYWEEKFLDPREYQALKRAI